MLSAVMPLPRDSQIERLASFQPLENKTHANAKDIRVVRLTVDAHL